MNQGILKGIILYRYKILNTEIEIAKKVNNIVDGIRCKRKLTLLNKKG